MTPTISQTLTNLPKGRYMLTVDMQASNRSATTIRLGKQHVFAGEQKGYFADQLSTAGMGDTYPMQTIAVCFDQPTDNAPITIGVSTEGAPNETWFKIDNFRLYLLTDEVADGILPTSFSQPHPSSSAIYDLTGRKVSSNPCHRLPHGIYIKNHKKFVVK